MHTLHCHGTWCKQRIQYCDDVVKRCKYCRNICRPMSDPANGPSDSHALIYACQKKCPFFNTTIVRQDRVLQAPTTFMTVTASTRPDSPKIEGTNHLAIVLVGVLGIVVLMMLIGVIVFIAWRRCCKKKPTQNERRTSQDGSTATLLNSDASDGGKPHPNGTIKNQNTQTTDEVPQGSGQNPILVRNGSFNYARNSLGQSLPVSREQHAPRNVRNPTSNEIELNTFSSDNKLQANGDQITRIDMPEYKLPVVSDQVHIPKQASSRSIPTKKQINSITPMLHAKSDPIIKKCTDNSAQTENRPIQVVQGPEEQHMDPLGLGRRGTASLPDGRNPHVNGGRRVQFDETRVGRSVLVSEESGAHSMCAEGDQQTSVKRRASPVPLVFEESGAQSILTEEVVGQETVRERPTVQDQEDSDM